MPGPGRERPGSPMAPRAVWTRGAQLGAGGLRLCFLHREMEGRDMSPSSEGAPGICESALSVGGAPSPPPRAHGTERRLPKGRRHGLCRILTQMTSGRRPRSGPTVRGDAEPRAAGSRWADAHHPASSAPGEKRHTNPSDRHLVPLPTGTHQPRQGHKNTESLRHRRSQKRRGDTMPNAKRCPGSDPGPDVEEKLGKSE